MGVIYKNEENKNFGQSIVFGLQNFLSECVLSGVF